MHCRLRHHLEALNRGVGGLHRLEPERRSAQPLDRAMIRLKTIVEELCLPVF
jgi:hypothetical protein